MENETKRQIIHAVFGVIFLAILSLFGREILMLISLVLLLLGSFLINVFFFKKNKIYTFLFSQFERYQIPFAGWGPAWYMTGILFLASFINEVNFIAAGIIILGFSDAFATLAGKKGTRQLPYNKKKTAEGTVAFILVSLLSYYFIGIKAIPLGIVTGIAESLPLPIDDNILIPLVVVIVFILL